MKRTIVVALICFCVFAFANSVSAQDMYAAWDTDNSAVWFYGELESSIEKVITFTVVQYDSTEVSDIKLPVDVRIGKTDENGRFEVKIPLKASGGMFKCFADTENEKTQCSFTFIDEDGAENLIETLNKKTTAEELENYLTENNQVFGVDIKLISTELCSMLSNRIKEAPFKTTMDFYNEYLGSVAIIKMKNGEATLPVILQYQYELGVSPDTLQGFEEEQLSKLKQTMKNVALSVESFEKDFLECVFLTKVMAQKKYKALRELIENEGEGYGFDVDAESDYMSMSLKDKVFSYMLSNMNKVATLEDAIELFDEAVENSAKTNDKVSGGSGGSGGSKGSGSIGGSRISVSYAEDIRFSDTASHWAKNYIEKLVKDGVVNGYPDGTFKPDNTITRAEFIKLVCEIAGLSYGAECNFSDVSVMDWFYPYVSIAYEKGIVLGSGNSFMPNNAISRQDAAVILHRYLNVENDGDADAYTDFDEISDYAVKAVGALTSVNIIKGDGNNFMPHRSLTRAEAVTLFYNAEDYFERQGDK